MSHTLKNTIILLLAGLWIYSCNEEKKPADNVTTNARMQTDITDCSDLDSLYNVYLQDIEGRIPEDSANKILNIPIRQEIGDSYINAYNHASTPGKTKYVKLSRKAIAFFYKYMLLNKRDSISFCFAKYDFSALREGLTDPNLSAKPEKNTRYTIIAADYTGRSYLPFEIKYTKAGKTVTKTFYDDWNQEYP